MKPLPILILLLCAARIGAAQSEQTVIADHGLGMAHSSFSVPDGFLVTQDVATNPQSGEYDRYWIELRNRAGSVIRMPGEVTYSSYRNETLEQALHFLFARGTQDVEDMEVGDLVDHPDLLAGPLGQRLLPQFEGTGIRVQAWRIPFQGRLEGNLLQGRAEFVHTDQGHAGIGTVAARVMMCHPEQIDHVLASVNLLDASFQPNPKRQAAVSSIQQRLMEQMTAAHQQRMANQQNMFEAHQRKMQGIYSANEQQNRQWRENFFGNWNTGSGSGGSGYSMNEAWRDTLTGQTTFQDPATGHQIKRDGHYNNWFTDGAGNYRGSDDSSFNPGNGWQRIEPVRPH